MDFAPALTRWTVRLSLAAYVVVFGNWLGTGNDSLARRWLRAVWTAGALLMLAHVMLAFAAFHGWSHQAAYEATARETAEVTGWKWGGGIYLNYALVAIWLLDALWWWIDAGGYARRPTWLTGALHAAILFMALNATVVFESGPIRAVAVVTALGLLLAGLWRWLRRRNRKSS